MDEKLSPCVYKETRVNVESDDPELIVTISLPGDGRPTPSSRILHRKQQAGQSSVAEDETTFAKEHLASSAFLHFRQDEAQPRSLLARILNGGRVLSIQCLDFTTQPRKEREAALNLQFIFSSSIRPLGVSFADHEKRGAVDVFVLTSSNDLYTIALRPDFFHTSSAGEAGIASWCKSYLSPSFAFRFPHRLIARSAQELFLCLHDGGLLRLTRGPGEDGSSWTETFYNEGGWGSSIRNFIPWQGNHTFQYEDMSLEQDAVTSVAFTSRPAEHHLNYLFAVSLNHRLKAWNLSSGKMEFSRDLLNQERQPHELPSFLIDPAQSDLVAVVDQKLRGDIEGCYLATFSPVGAGQFKFWAITEGGSSGLFLQDLYPNHVFEPSLSSSEAWSMARFRLVAGASHRDTEMWILWKNNTSYRVESLKFDLLNVSEDWQNPWLSVTTESMREKPLPALILAQPTDPTDNWVDYIFYPGQFTRATLETALSMYNRSLSLPFNGPSSNAKPLKERVCSSVASSVVLHHNADKGMGYERFCVDTDFQWRRYFRIVSELNRQRGEAVCLDYDSRTGMPWVVNADGITALRQCNDTEVVWHNRNGLSSRTDAVCRLAQDTLSEASYGGDATRMACLIKAASTFQDAFSDALLHMCAVTLESEILQDPSEAVEARIRSFYDRCNFTGQINDDDYTQLTRDLNQLGGLSGLDTSLFENVIQMLSSRESCPTCDLSLTEFGEKTIVKGAQEMIFVTTTIVFNLLVLLVFVENEKDDQEDVSAALETPSVYLDLLGLYREYAVLGWFAKTGRSESGTKPHHDAGEMSLASQTPLISTYNHRVSTVLQYPWIRIWKPLWLQPPRPMSFCLTKYINHALAGIELSDPGKYNQQVMWLQRTFLRRGDTDLASQFLRYQPNTAWSVYIKARFYLCTGQYAMAAAYFKQAAFNLAHREGIKELDVNETDDLFSTSDAQYFNAGMPKYYLHVVRLFEHENVYSFTVEFARTGLQFTRVRHDQDNSELLTELLSRMFNASLKTSCFDEAYSALMRYSDHSTQRNDLVRLIGTMCEDGSGSQLIAFSFLGLQNAVDEVLVTKCQNILNIRTGPPYHAILYAWRLKRGDSRGAATALHERLQRLQSISTASTGAVGKPDDRPDNTAVTRGYLALINTLASIDPSEAWLLSSSKIAPPSAGREDHNSTKRRSTRSTPGSSSTEHTKRKLVTIDDVRKGYQDELDRIAYIANDQFSFTAAAADDDEMDVESVL